MREISKALSLVHHRTQEIREAPEEHKPRLVVSDEVRGSSPLIMVSLQVSANRAQAASDKRAIADHETLIALHAMAVEQLEQLRGAGPAAGAAPA